MVRSLLIVVLCGALIGCASPLWPSVSRVPAPTPAVPAGTPQLQVLAEAIQQGEIPLVPVPPPPLYKHEKEKGKGPAPAQPADKEIVPATAQGNPPPIATTPAPGAILPPEPATPGPVAPGPVAPGPGTQIPQAQPVRVEGAPMPGGATPDLNPAGPGGNLQPLEKVLEQAQARYAAIDSYIARFTRREVVGGKREAEELMLFKFRKEPYSVYFKWLGETSTGREVVYVDGKYDNKIQTLLAAGDVPFMPAGKRMALSPDNILVQSATRHSIRDAGVGATLERILRTQAAIAQGDMSRGQLTDLGMQRRPDYASASLRMIEHTLPPGFDKHLPNGGKRLIGFCPECQLPVLLQTYDDKAQEVEYYRYDRLQPAVALDDLDFNPDVLWKKPDAPRAGTN